MSSIGPQTVRAWLRRKARKELSIEQSVLIWMRLTRRPVSKP